MIKENKLPNVVIAGAPKCATTSVFSWLAQHPEVCVSDEKETLYFMDLDYPLCNKKSNYHLHGLEGYLKYFNHYSGEKVVLEATPDYLYQETALNNIPNLITKPKNIFILRKPSDRVYSLFRFAQHNLSIIDKKMTFPDYIKRIQDNPEKYFPNRLILQSGILHGEYVTYLRKWREKTEFTVYLFEDLVRDQVVFMENLSRDIDISSSFWSSFDFKTKNETYAINSSKLHRTVKELTAYIPNGSFPYLRSIYKKLNKKEASKKSDEDIKMIKELDEYYSPFNSALQSEFAVNVDQWQ